MNRAETEDGSYASARNRKLLAEWAAKAGENEYAEPALNPCQTTAYAFFTGDYAGDARFGGAPLGEARMLIYAVDPKTKVSREQRVDELVERVVANAGVIEGAPQAQERKVRDELTDRAQAA